ncbi:hypothetical protein AKJ64_01080 [candidate division MSBL1 archaeon SCGC-AAA259E17]|uniref:Uncharacterized protein n=1 Tax=candidate division MSBL1 archaeon SCGC-AAA259E17 TaxID=1698263 RepID=A0A133UG92_9EURY|nr:hypothetical protein AKJ64_01080 [candidate division MSBL1 archaeon SCGC-AAA259E17]
MPEETITVRIDLEWKKRVEKLASERRETKSDVVRKSDKDTSVHLYFKKFENTQLRKNIW